MAVAPTRTDAGLVRRLQARDTSAWEELYAEYQPRLRAFGYRLAGNAHDADDLVHETFVRALPALDRLDPDRVDLAAYLFATEKNLFLRQVERAKRAEPTAEVPEPDLPTAIEDDPERSALLHRQQEEVRVANARLDPRQRLVLALCELEDRSYAEIGELVGLNENAVAQLVFRARERLRTELRLVQVDPESLPEECRAFLPLLSQHLDGKLRGPKLETTLAHLEGCERCQAALADMQDAKRRYRALLLPPLGMSTEEARASTGAALEQAGYWRRTSGRGGVRRHRGAAAVGAAAVAIVCMAGGVGAAKLLAETEDTTPLAVTTAPAQTQQTRHATQAPRAQQKAKAPKPKPKPTPRQSPETTKTAAAAPPPPPPPTTTPKPKPPAAATTRRAKQTPPPPSAPSPPKPPPPKVTTAPTVSTSETPSAPPATTAPPPDTTAPTVTFEATPETETTSRTATFSFSASEPESTFACSYDGDPFVACESSATVQDAGVDEHSFAVRATDAAGNTGPPTVARWTVVAPLPDLVVSLTSTSVTVKNAGAGAAGSSIAFVSGIGTFTIPALGPSATATRTYACKSGTIVATADETKLVAESDETNNTATRVVSCLGFGT